jgi:Lrp/AsnC family transcriptional regulator for asnA, asnC and gidA
MNELDQHIADALTADARLSFRKIARQVDKSTDTVINHYNRMVERGEIRGSTVVVDTAKMGYEGVAAFQIDVTTSRGAEPNTILDALIKMPNIILATKTVGEHDLLALAVIHDLPHYSQLGREIAEIPGVKDISSNVWPATEDICPKYFII